MGDSLKKLIKSWFLPPAIHLFMQNIKIKLSFYFLLSLKDRVLLSATNQLKNRHVGQRCFILGAGSSVKAQNIKKLADEVVISVSNTFVHPDFKIVSPRYHVVPPLITSHGYLYSDEKFVDWLKGMETATGQAEMFFHIGDKAMIERNGLFRNRIVHWVEYTVWNEDFNTPIDLAMVPHVESVSELAVTIAVYLGFDEIYLLGIDHDWFNGTLVHFYDNKSEHALRPDLKDLDFIDAELQMRRHANIFRKYKYLYSKMKNIFNANSDAKNYIDVFPKVEFDTLFPNQTPSKNLKSD
jgi:hypothetical protein